MGNLVFKPATGGGNKVIFQNQAGNVDALTVDDSGAIAIAGNTTLSGTANNLGTVTAGNISNSAIVYPTGHQVNMKHYTNGTRTTSCACSQGDFWTVTYTKLLAGTKLLVYVGVPIHGCSNGTSGEYITIGGTQYGSFSYAYGAMSGWDNGTEMMNGMAEKTGQGAGSVAIGWGCSTSAGGNLVYVINPNSTDESRNQQKVSTITVWEVMV